MLCLDMCHMLVYMDLPLTPVEVGDKFTGSHVCMYVCVYMYLLLYQGIVNKHRIFKFKLVKLFKTFATTE